MRSTSTCHISNLVQTVEFEDDRPRADEVVALELPSISSVATDLLTQKGCRQRRVGIFAPGSMSPKGVDCG